MREFEHKKYIGKLLYSRYTLIIIFILIVLMGKAVFSAYDKYSRSKDARDLSEGEVAELKARATVVDSRIKMLETEVGKEREIREKFGFVKEGEKLAIIVGDDTPPPPKYPKKSFLDKIFDWFR